MRQLIVLGLFFLVSENFAAFGPGLRSITIYTLVKSNTGSEHFALELDNKAFENLLANKELVKSPKTLQNAFEFLNLLDGRCDIQLKCNKKIEQCDKCEKCKNCPTCTTCKPCFNPTTTPTTTPSTTPTPDPPIIPDPPMPPKPPITPKPPIRIPPKTGRPYIPSVPPSRPPNIQKPEIIYPRPNFPPFIFNITSSPGGFGGVTGQDVIRPLTTPRPLYEKLPNGTYVPIIYDV